MLSRRGLTCTLSILIGAALLVLSPGRSAHAQAPPDVVRLAGGGMLRGSIIEHDPESHVLIMLPSGEQRRVESGEITWAGPATEMPSPTPAPAPEPPPAPAAPPPPLPPPVAPPPYAPPAPPTAPVRFETDRAGAHLYVLRGERPAFERVGRRVVYRPELVYQHVCAMPCEAPLFLGTQVFAVSMSDADANPRQLLLEDRVEGPRTLRVRWNDRELFRIIGGLVLGIGGALGATGLAVGLGACLTNSCRDPWLLPLGIGAAVTGISLGIGIGFVVWRDDVRLEPVIPASDPPRML